MIIWGSAQYSQKLGDLGESDCPVCEKYVPFHAFLQYTHRHIWYLFGWVSGREYLAVCSNCGNGQAMDKAEAQQLFPKDHIPFVRKKGILLALVLALLLLVAGMIGNRTDQSQMAEYLAAPQIGDSYLADLSAIDGGGYQEAKKAYGVMRLVKVHEDGMVFVLSNEAYSQKSGLRKKMRQTLSREDFDWEYPIVLTPDEVRALQKRRVIYEVRRK